MRRDHVQVLVVWDAAAQAWVTQVLALDISTFGETRDQAIEATREAILGYIEAAMKEGLPIPDLVDRAELVEIEVARV